MKKKEEIILPKNPYMPYIEMSIRAEKKAKELAEQKKLDFQKWLDSEYRKTDLSGLMPWCLFCEYRDKEKYTCHCPQEIRSSDAVCCKAYREMKDKIDKE